jgi:SAM-dependent methyltransferase
MTIKEVFGNYARYYNLLYNDKNYAKESDYVDSLIQRFSKKTVSTILDMGCGTGKHATLLSQKGYSVDGIDRSDTMIIQAQKNATKNMHFFVGDITVTKLEKKYDVIILLFHVFSYITKNEEIDLLFRNIAEHLTQDGIIIFDFWYGPAVLTDRPSVRIKRLEDDMITVTRIAEPILHPNENTVDVNYEVIIHDKIQLSTENIVEKHTMRYFFIPELEVFLNRNGFSLSHCEEWMTGHSPGFDTWGICAVADLKCDK